MGTLEEVVGATVEAEMEEVVGESVGVLQAKQSDVKEAYLTLGNDDIWGI